MKLFKSVSLLLVVACILSAGDAFAGQGGGGGGRGGGGGGGGGKGNNGNADKAANMKWYSSVNEATGWATVGAAPVMVAIGRVGNVEDLKAQEKIGSWPPIATVSSTLFAAVKISADSEDGVNLVKLMGPKSVPGLIWMDQYGNPILSQPMPDVAVSVANVIANWKSTLSNIDRFFKDHLARGDANLKSNKLREAYMEYALLSKFKGPIADKAKEAQATVSESWLKVAAVAAKLPVGSRDSVAMLKGLREEVKNTDFAVVLEKELLNAMMAAEAAKVAAAPDTENKVAGSPVVEVASAPAPAADPVAPPAPAPEKSLVVKPLSEVIKTSAPVARDANDSTLNMAYLVSSANPVLKQAGEALQHGIAAYQKATADSMERGEARNTLLRTAHTEFDKSITLLEQAAGGKPDDTVKRLEERVSMLLYASLKYQSL